MKLRHIERVNKLKLRCIKTVQMIGETEKERFQAFTEGNEYNARRGTVKGLDGNPYEVTDVLRARNDKGESHIIKRLNSGDLNDFFKTHFEVIK